MLVSHPFVHMCSTGRLLCHWDPTWSWAQLQLVAACHGPGNTIIILTAARVLFLVAHNGDKQQQSRGSSAGAEPLASSADSKFTQQQLQFQQQQVLEKFSVKVRRAVLQQGWTAAVTPAAAARLRKTLWFEAAAIGACLVCLCPAPERGLPVYIHARCFL